MKAFKLIYITLVTLLLTIQCSDQESIIQDIVTNIPPSANSVTITGAPVVEQTLKGEYTYFDKEGDREKDSQYKWYRADTNTGLNKIEIPNATDTLYVVTDADVSKYISFEVTPIQIDGERGETVLSNYIGPVNSNETISASAITLYQVEGNTLTNAYNYTVVGDCYEAQQDTSKHQEIWELILKAIPDEYLSRINQFEIFWGETSAQNARGYVEPSADLTTWKLAMAIDYAYPDDIFNGDNETLLTALHEFAHILTLNETQIDETASENNCDNYYPDYPKSGFARYGCSFDDSYLNQFYDTFWKAQWEQAEKDGSINSSTYYFYNEYPEQFVSDYAGTTPSEDLAETYMFYILNQTSPKDIAQQKIDYFENFAEFEAIKVETRNKLGSLADRISSKSLNDLIHSISTTGGHRGCIKIH